MYELQAKQVAAELMEQGWRWMPAPPPPAPTAAMLWCFRRPLQALLIAALYLSAIAGGLYYLIAR